MSAAYGAPCWVSLMARDLRATEHFYGAVLGWDFTPGPLGPLGPEFRAAKEEGLPVAGVSELAASWELAVAWSVYFQVESADLVAERIRERGATVAVGPMPLGDGRVALAADPFGATFGLWQGPRTENWSVGSGRAPAWLQLRTRDAFAAALFYGEIFNWSAGSSPYEVAYETAEDEVFIRDKGHAVAGLRGGGVEAAPDPEVRPRWQIYFRVPDVGRAVSAAVGTGGTVVSPAERNSLGESATLRDPDGAVFSVLAA